jgi:hypothetical protein
MRHFRFCLLFLVLVGQCANSAQISGQSVRIDLQGHGYLKDLFDAGLQPKRTDDGLSRCVVQEKMLTFDLGQNNSITIPAQSCFFHVLSDDSLYEIQAASPPFSLEEARTWMAPICRTFGKPEQELDDFLAKVRNGYDHFGWLGDENPGFEVGMSRPARDSGLPGMGARLQSRVRDNIHPVQIVVDVRWERPARTLIPHTSPLTPPKGYEQLSMEPVPEEPEWLRKGEEPSSFVKSLYSTQEIERMREAYYAKHGRTSSGVRPATQAPDVSPDAKDAEGSPYRLKWLWVIVVGFLVAVGWIVSRKPRSLG